MSKLADAVLDESQMAAVLSLDRRYLVQVVRKAVGLRSPADDSEEAFSYHTAEPCLSSWACWWAVP